MVGCAFVPPTQLTFAVRRLHESVPSEMPRIEVPSTQFRMLFRSPTMTSGPVFVPHGGGGTPGPSVNVPEPPPVALNAPSCTRYVVPATVVNWRNDCVPHESSLHTIGALAG